MEKKFELTDDAKVINGVDVFRIKALRSFGNVKAGDLGGFVEKEANLSMTGSCWIYDEAVVFNDAIVKHDARVFGEARVCDNATVDGSANVFGYAILYNFAHVSGNALVFDSAKLYDNSVVSGNGVVRGISRLHGNIHVSGYTHLSSMADVCKHTDYMSMSGMYTESNETFFICMDNEIRGIGKYSSDLNPMSLKMIRKAAMSNGDLEYVMLCELVEIHFQKNVSKYANY